MENTNPETSLNQPTQAPPAPPQNSNPLVLKLLILIVILLTIILVGGIAYLLGASQKQSVIKPTEEPVNTQTPQATPPPTISQTSTPSATPLKTSQVPLDPNLKTFTSQTLKISFNYLLKQPDYPNDQISTKVVGNKVFVGFSKDLEQGQWVEVFKKDKNDTLAQAIKKQFLTGIAEKDCFVIDSTAENKFPATYKVAQISFPYDPNSGIPMFATENKCPQTYTRSNGISFFLGDSNHPDIFLFFSIGQYGIMAGKETMWQDTVKFL